MKKITVNYGKQGSGKSQILLEFIRKAAPNIESKNILSDKVFKIQIGTNKDTVDTDYYIDEFDVNKDNLPTHLGIRNIYVATQNTAFEFEEYLDKLDREFDIEFINAEKRNDYDNTIF